MTIRQEIARELRRPRFSVKRAPKKERLALIVAIANVTAEVMRDKSKPSFIRGAHHASPVQASVPVPAPCAPVSNWKSPYARTNAHLSRLIK